MSAMNREKSGAIEEKKREQEKKKKEKNERPAFCENDETM